MLMSYPSPVPLIEGLGSQKTRQKTTALLATPKKQINRDPSEIEEEHSRLQKETQKLRLEIVNLKQVIFDMQQKGVEKPDTP